MTDPLDPRQPSPQRQAELDQLRAAAAQMADSLDTLVDEVVARGWTRDQARAIVLHVLTYGPQR